MNSRKDFWNFLSNKFQYIIIAFLLITNVASNFTLTRDPIINNGTKGTFPTKNGEVTQPPKILTGASERTSPQNVVFYDDDVNQKLVCVFAGNPPPEIKWFRNTHPFSDIFLTLLTTNSRNETWGNVSRTTSELHIPKTIDLGADLPGIFTCNATNGSQPDGSYEIKVEVRKRKSWWIWVTITLSISGVIVVCTYFWQRCLWNKEIKELAKGLGLPVKQLKKILNGDNELNNKIKSILRIFRDGVHVNEELARALRNDSLNDDFIGRMAARVIRFPTGKFLIKADLEIIEGSILGKGHYGKVVKGEYRESSGEKIQVAVKMSHIRADPEETMELNLALEEELKILSYVGTHEYVVRFIGVVLPEAGVEESLQAVLELCEASLEAYLKTYQNRFVALTPTKDSTYYSLDFNTYTKEDLIRWSFQIACGMQHLISRKIIHRDLGARNVLLFRKNGNLDVRITDFGLSKYGSTYDTKSGRKSLPWRYLAPELLDSHQKFSEATDVWSFGITLWEIFTLAKKAPYHEFDRSDFRFINAIKNKRIRNSKPEHADTAIYDIMLRCWDAKPEKRPTFSQLIQLIMGHLPASCLETIPTAAYEISDQGSAYKYILHLLESDRSTLNGRETSRV